MMSAVWIILACLAVCLPSGLAKVDLEKECSHIPAMQHFQVKPFLGLWYVRGTSGSNIPNSCTSETFKYNKRRGADIEINYIADGQKDYITITGSAKPKNKKKYEGRWIKSLKKSGGLEVEEYIVLHTDYKNYAIALSCSDKFNPKLRQAFILTRAQDLDKASNGDKIKDKISDQLNDLKLQENMFTPIVQRNCPALH